MGRDFTLQSRSEHILASIIDGTEYNAAKEGQPLSRIDLTSSILFSIVMVIFGSEPSAALDGLQHASLPALLAVRMHLTQTMLDR